MDTFDETESAADQAQGDVLLMWKQLNRISVEKYNELQRQFNRLILQNAFSSTEKQELYFLFDKLKRACYLPHNLNNSMKQKSNQMLVH